MAKVHIESTKKIFGIDTDRILFCPKKSLDTAKHKLFKELKHSTISFFIVVTLLILGAFLFFYIEHCYSPTPRRIEPHEKAYQDLCAKATMIALELAKTTNSTHISTNHTSLEGYNTTDYKHVLNYTIELCTNFKPRDYTRRCEMKITHLAEWFDFTSSVAFTIGFGRVVPYSNTGKVFTILYAIPSITLGMSLYLSAGHIVTVFTEVCVLLFYKNCLNHRLEKKTFSVHVLIGQIIVTVLLWVFFSIVCMYASYQPITNFVDASYVAFLTVSTVGFGDFSYSSERAFRVNFMVWAIHALLFCVATGAIASLIANVNELIINGNIKIPKWCRRTRKNRDVLTKMKASFRNLHKQNEDSSSNTERNAESQQVPTQNFLLPSNSIKLEGVKSNSNTSKTGTGQNTTKKKTPEKKNKGNIV